MKNLQSGLIGAALSQLFTPLVNAQDSDALVRPAKVMEVVAKPKVLQVQYPAIADPSPETELSFRVSGRLVEFKVRAADRDTSGDVIAVLDTRDFMLLRSSRVSMIRPRKSSRPGPGPRIFWRLRPV